MIYEVEDDPDDFADIAEPEPSWVDCPILSRGEMLAVIEKHGNLDGRAKNLFRDALQRPQKSDLFKHYIGPNLYHLTCTRGPEPDQVQELASRDNCIDDRTLHHRAVRCSRIPCCGRMRLMGLLATEPIMLGSSCTR